MAWATAMFTSSKRTVNLEEALGVMAITESLDTKTRFCRCQAFPGPVLGRVVSRTRPEGAGDPGGTVVWPTVRRGGARRHIRKTAR